MSERTRELAASWDANAAAWTEAVRAGRIESRRLITNAAVLEAVLAPTPRRVLDVGCGEGWLCRALAAQGIEAVGVDAAGALVEAARAAGGGLYRRLDYAQLADAAELGSFDVAVCNFSLLDEDLAPALHALRARSTRLVIQTVHPWSARGEAPYADGWRTERFECLGTAVAAPMPWYYRTLASWLEALAAARWRVAALREPLHPHSGLPASLLLEAAA